MSGLHDEVDVEVGDNVVKVDDTLYFVGADCKYCNDNAVCIAVVDDKRVGPDFPVCDTHRDKLEESDKDAKFYELTDNE
jgi:hypothetical protein